MNAQTTGKRLLLRITLAVLATATATLTTLAQDDVDIQVMQVDTSRFPEIDVYVSATDADGEPVTTISPEDFVLLENDEEIEGLEVTQAGEYGPVSTVLVIDKSGSMDVEGKMAAAREAAVAFVDLMRPEDFAGVIAFDTVVTTVQELTSDRELLVDGIESIETGSDTALYDALHAASAMLEPATGRRAIIAVTDGINTAGTHTMTETLELVAEQGVSIYTIGLGDPAVGTGDFAGMDEPTLQRIAEESLGAYSHAPTGAYLTALYESLSLRIQNEYKLTYTSPTPLRDGVPREIAVTVAAAASEAEVGAGYNPGGVIPEVEPASTWALFGIILLVLVILLVLPTVVGWVAALIRGEGKRLGRRRKVRLTDTPEAKKRLAKKKPAKKPAKKAAKKK
jgi:VWFA-related protein